MEALVEVPQDGFPVEIPRLHLVQLVFHVGGKFHINNILEPLHHQASDHLSQRRGMEPLVLLIHIFPVLNGGHNGGIGGRTAYALFLHGLDQRGLRIPGRGLGKVLLLPDVRGLGPVTLEKFRQGAAHSLGLLVLALLVHRQEAVEFHALVGGTEGMSGTPGVDGYRIIQGICHLGGQEPAPDQLIQPVLVLGEAPLNPFRVQLHMGGTDGLVGILGTGLGLEGMEAPIVVGSTVPALDETLRRSHGLIAEPQGVGTHIGD